MTDENDFTADDVAVLEAEWHDAECGALYALYDAECDCDDRPALARLRAIAEKIKARNPVPRSPTGR